MRDFNPLYLIPAFLFGISFAILIFEPFDDGPDKCVAFCEPLSSAQVAAVEGVTSQVLTMLPWLLLPIVVAWVVSFAFRLFVRYCHDRYDH